MKELFSTIKSNGEMHKGARRGIKGNLNILTDSAKQIACGDLDMNLATNGKDEFSVLLNSFANTIDVLRGTITDINTATEKI